MTTPTHFYIQTASPGGHGFARWGVCEEGWYTIADGRLTLTDSDGTPRLTHEGQPRSAPLGPKDNPRQIAGRLLRESLTSGRTPGLGKRIIYPQSGVA